jgi:release factor glutamine methyltransferase
VTLREALNRGAFLLEAAGIEGARREARLLLAEAAELTQEELLRALEPSPFGSGRGEGASGATALTPSLSRREREIEAGFAHLIARRAAREPLALILGWQEFWSLRFRVSPATLIPRADSETLIEAAVASRRSVQSVLDLGTGTGCLLLAALTEYPNAWGVGVDRNRAAAGLAAWNARALGLASRAAMIAADWAAPIGGRFDLILSNPPYIERGAIPGLMPEVARFEPASALDGGVDGLDAYRAITAGLPRLLAPGGLAILELGAGQAEAVAGLARRVGLNRLATRKDLAGIERALLIQAD